MEIISHFYSGIQGQAGEGTRTGSVRSGIRAYVQTWTGRIETNLHHDSRDDRDVARIGIGPGPSGTGRNHTFPAFDLNTVTNAMSYNDPKFDKILARIDAEFRKLDGEAPKAIKRGERARRADTRAKERAEKARKIREAEFAATISQAEVEHYLAIVFDGPDPEQRSWEGLDDDDKVRARMAAEGWMPEHKPYRDENGDLIVNSSHGFGSRKINVTQGVSLNEDGVYA